jgi:hypothetical protein
MRSVPRSTTKVERAWAPFSSALQARLPGRGCAGCVVEVVVAAGAGTASTRTGSGRKNLYGVWAEATEAPSDRAEQAAAMKSVWFMARIDAP